MRAQKCNHKIAKKAKKQNLAKKYQNMNKASARKCKPKECISKITSINKLKKEKI